MDEEELIKKVEKAASKGARKGKLLNSLLSLAITVGLVIGGVAYIKFSINNTWQDFKEQFGFEDPAEKHDMVIENNGFLGYTAADFSDPILGDRSQLKKLEVYEAHISDAVTLSTFSASLVWERPAAVRASLIKAPTVFFAMSLTSLSWVRLRGFDSSRIT